MADIVLCDEILIALEEKGPITVDRPCEFAERAELSQDWSNTKVKQALGSLIHNGRVQRFRSRPQSCTDQGQPITFRLARA